MPKRKRTTRRATGSGSYWQAQGRHFFRLHGHTVADKDKERAEAKFAELRRKLAAEVDLVGGRQLLRDYLPRYIAEDVANHVKHATAYDYQRRADYYILPTLGDYRLCDLTYKIGLAWLNAMLNEPDARGHLWALSVVRQAVRLLVRALDAAVTAGLLDHNVLAGLKAPSRRKGDELHIDEDDELARTFTPDQVMQLLADVQSTNRYHGLYPLYVLAVRLGLRRGELLGLRWKDIDFGQRLIRIRQQVIRLDSEIVVTTPKTDSSRRDIPAPDDVLLVLLDHQQALGELGHTYVFPNAQGSYRRPDGINQHFRRVCKRLSFTGYAFHSLRKTAITAWRRGGMDLEIASSLAGHSGVKVTAEVYSDATIDRKRAALDKTRT